MKFSCIAVLIDHDSADEKKIWLFHLFQWHNHLFIQTFTILSAGTHEAPHYWKHKEPEPAFLMARLQEHNDKHLDDDSSNFADVPCF